MKHGFKKFLIFLAFGALLFTRPAMAATNISSVNRWAWNDVTGWMDFYVTSTVYVYVDRLSGYASSPVGYVALNCDSTPNGDICAGPAGSWKIVNTSGVLSGWAWNDAVGWISFNCSNTSTCGTVDYKVQVDLATGEFSGWAWNDAVGWISFNCSNTSTCGTVNYKVDSTWAEGRIVADLTSSVFDTQITGGSAINSIMWQGTQPVDTGVKFRIASSNCSNGATNPPTCSTGAWEFLGSDGSSSSYYSAVGANIPVGIRAVDHNNKRYFRYKVFLESDTGQTLTPEITNIIINWSP